MENLKKAKEVYRALIVLADFTGMTESEIISNISFFNKEIFQKFKSAVNMVNDFNSKSLKERSELLGYSYIEKPNGQCEVSTILN